jgi:predicted outer membrane repeat protein
MLVKSRSTLNVLGLLALVAALLGSALIAAPAGAAGTVYRVVPGGMSSGTCETWANACSLVFAQGLALSPGDQLWVKAGVYTPNFNVVLGLVDGVGAYGGFNGTETALGQRDARLNVTIISGDIGGDDDSSNADGNFINETAADIVGTNGGNLVSIDGVSWPATSSTVLDGFTITGGDGGIGGGLICNGYGSTGSCNPTLSSLTFSGNRATNGGAIFNWGDSGGESSPTLTDVTFVGNSAVSGGAIYNNGYQGTSSPTLTNVTFSGNSATTNNGGAMVNDAWNGSSSPTLTNVTFSGNSAAQYGGAIYGRSGSTGTSSPTLTNVILWGDSAFNASWGNEIYNDGAITPTINYSVVEGGAGGTGNLATDPLLGPLADNGGSTMTMALPTGSPAIDAGTNTGAPATDQRGAGRPQDGDEDSTATADIGAYEFGIWTISGNAGAPGTELDYDNDGPQTAIADSGGDYAFSVAGQWSGTVTPSKTGIVFTPGARFYGSVTADLVDQDFFASLPPPANVHVHPLPGASDACLAPQVAVTLILDSLMRLPSGEFNPAVVTLKVDDVDHMGEAQIAQSGAKPATHAQILYTPPSNLSVGSHKATIVFPSSGGPVTYNWFFTVVNSACPASAPLEAPLGDASSGSALTEPSTDSIEPASNETGEGITAPADTDENISAPAGAGEGAIVPLAPATAPQSSGVWRYLPHPGLFAALLGWTP